MVHKPRLKVVFSGFLENAHLEETNGIPMVEKHWVRQMQHLKIEIVEKVARFEFFVV